MKKILLDVSPTGVQHIVHVDEDELITEEFTPSAVEQKILDDCARKRLLHQRNGGFQHAAQIPINTYMAWKKEWKTKYRQEFTWPTFHVMKINSRDNSKLRTGYKRSGSMLL